MSRTVATANSGNTNRRFILLAVTLGLLGAILVYAAFSRGSSSGGAGGGVVADTPVVVAKIDIPARSKITPAMVEVRLVAQDGRGALAYADPAEVVGQVTRFPIAAHEQVLSTKVVTFSAGATAASRSLSFVVPRGKRGFAISVSEVSSASGLILPGDYVDLMVIYDVEFQTKAGDPTSKEKADNYLVQMLLQNVLILSVAQTVVDVVPEATPVASGQVARNSEAKPGPEAKTVTLALTPEQAQRVYLAEGNGRIRLALRAFGDGDEQPIDYMTEVELFPRNLPNPFLR